MSLDLWRGKIDELDLKLLEILNHRALLALRIAEGKREKELPLRCPSREEEVLRKLVAQNPGPLPEEAIRRIFRVIFSECLRLEEVACGDRGDEAERDPGPDRGR